MASTKQTERINTMAKNKKQAAELTKPDMKKVTAKIRNTAKHAEAQPSNAHAAENLARLTKKYPSVSIEAA
jgi:hypothetical protein